MVHQESGSAEEVLEGLLGQRKREAAGPLWKKLRLDWVRNWDQNCQTAVLLSRLRHTGRVHTSQPSPNASFPEHLVPPGCWGHVDLPPPLRRAELTSCDPVVLWRYLTALHDRRRVIDWIENSGASQWPELTPALVNDHTVCSTYLRENILDLLARYVGNLPACNRNMRRVQQTLQQLLISRKNEKAQGGNSSFCF